MVGKERFGRPRGAVALALTVAVSLVALAASGQEGVGGKKVVIPKPKPAAKPKSAPTPRRKPSSPSRRTTTSTPKPLWTYLPNPAGLPTPVPPPAKPKTKTNPVDGAEMVWIPAGTFIMGSRNDGKPGSDLEATDEEKPQRLVYLSGYWMYRYPVTVAQFRKFTEAKPYKFDWSAHKPDWGWQDDHPMVRVTWEEARAYCEWAKGTLPTEAQWEKAARGTDGRMYPWGNDFGSSKLWCSRESDLDRKQTASVFRASNMTMSPFGCVDMAGNVWQWCADWFQEDYYKHGSVRDPKGGNGTMRVLRGGSWGNTMPRIFRGATRTGGEPQERQFLIFDCGLRVTLSGP